MRCILKKTLHDAVRMQPRLQQITLYPVCDAETGHFLVLATGWDKQSLVDEKVVIEEDNFEEGLTTSLVAAGIRNEDILLSSQQKSD
ncbi:XisI protein [Desulfobulbus sp. F1]|nr:XisI protein [Desulfobulbus sp. F1]